MILVWVTNEQFGEVADLVFDDKIGYRNPKYFKQEERLEKCDGVYIHGNFPKVEQAYKDKLVLPENAPKPYKKRVMGVSTDYTIAELRELKPDVEDWEEFTKGDKRKSIDRL